MKIREHPRIDRERIEQWIDNALLVVAAIAWTVAWYCAGVIARMVFV